MTRALSILVLFVSGTALAQETPPPMYSGVDSQGARPRPQVPDPVLFFEAKAYWPSLGIDEPRTAWEHAQRGMYRQDDLEDVDGAMEDYLRALELNDHLLIAHARLGTIALNRGAELAQTGTSSSAALAQLGEAVFRFQEVLAEQPHRQGMNLKIGDARRIRFRITGNPADADEAISAYRTELEAAPSNQHCWYQLAFLLRDRGRMQEAKAAVRRYLELAALHGDPYPYKILTAEKLEREL